MPVETPKMLAGSTNYILPEDALLDAQLLPRSANMERETAPANWVINASVLWEHRRILARVAAIAFVVSFIIAFVLPKQYKSTARIMPPDNSSGGAAMFAALAGRALGGGSSGGSSGLASLASSLLGGRNTSALFVDLLGSGTIKSHLIDQFNLQHVYHKRYRIDTAKRLARRTTITDDKKSGVISITVEDTDPRRARDMVQAYLNELNLLVNRTSTSSAHQERIFIEHRLKGVQAELERAQLELSEFSSTHTTIDIKEQTHAMVDAAAKLQAELIVGQSELDSLRQIYGSGNIRVRAAEARVTDLQHELEKMSGNSAPLTADGNEASTNGQSGDELYPSLRQLPRLGVPFTDLYRRVKVQETIYELLTQQYEVARIEEAKDVPVISVIDSPGIAEKKSWPPRLLLTLLLTMFAVGATSVGILGRRRWSYVSPADPRKVLAQQIEISLRNRLERYRPQGREGNR